MNALFYDPQQQLVVDYVGGMKDIKKKLVRPIIPLPEIFSDDPVRMIRAVKYAAAAGFTLPLSLKLKIKKQSALLSSISPSRLTEEIFKIIHSSRAAAIVEALDTMGLYAYLQPGAAKLMKENSSFRRRYLQSMVALNQEGFKNLSGEALGALINDYLEDIADWERGIAENYKEIFAAARSFVLPMNPPRFELEHAVRRFFAGHGVNVKRSHVAERPRPQAHEDGEARADSEPAKRRRRRRTKAQKAESSGE
jgi:poly(A) polymerase